MKCFDFFQGKSFAVPFTKYFWAWSNFDQTSKAGYPQPKDEVVGVSCKLSVVSAGGYFEI